MIDSWFNTLEPGEIFYYPAKRVKSIEVKRESNFISYVKDKEVSRCNHGVPLLRGKDKFFSLSRIDSRAQYSDSSSDSSDSESDAGLFGLRKSLPLFAIAIDRSLAQYTEMIDNDIPICRWFIVCDALQLILQRELNLIQPMVFLIIDFLHSRYVEGSEIFVSREKHGWCPMNLTTHSSIGFWSGICCQLSWIGLPSISMPCAIRRAHLTDKEIGFRQSHIQCHISFWS